MLENAEMNDVELEKQQQLIDAWASLSKKPDLRPEEAAEYELQRRISACTQGDDSATRTAERIKMHKAEKKLDEWQRGKGEGQTEEEFLAEMEGKSETYARAVERARKAVGL